MRGNVLVMTAPPHRPPPRHRLIRQRLARQDGPNSTAAQAPAAFSEAPKTEQFKDELKKRKMLSRSATASGCADPGCTHADAAGRSAAAFDEWRTQAAAQCAFMQDSLVQQPAPDQRPHQLPECLHELKAELYTSLARPCFHCAFPRSPLA
jgi:hypothetical protein